MLIFIYGKAQNFSFRRFYQLAMSYLFQRKLLCDLAFYPFHQEVRLPTNLFAGVSVGYFTNYRYGTALDVRKYFLNGNVALRGHLGYTGYASYPKRLGVDEPEKIWQYGDFDYVDYKIGIDYFIAKWNLKVGGRLWKRIV